MEKFTAREGFCRPPEHPVGIGKARRHLRVERGEKQTEIGDLFAERIGLVERLRRVRQRGRRDLILITFGARRAKRLRDAAALPGKIAVSVERRRERTEHVAHDQLLRARLDIFGAKPAVAAKHVVAKATERDDVHVARAGKFGDTAFRADRFPVGDEQKDVPRLCRARKMLRHPFAFAGAGPSENKMKHRSVPLSGKFHHPARRAE